MNYAICTVAAAPVRKENAHRSEMVNQLLFGERMEVLEEKEEWFRIRSLYDGYEGWLTSHLITTIEAAWAEEPVRLVASGLINPLTLPDQLVNIPMGSELTGYDEETRLLWNGQYKYHGTVRDIKRGYDADLFRKIIHAWMNAPYLWGGKTMMGVDCSGFVQTIFKLMGIQLKRDAWQQAEQGSETNLDQSKEGDLGFFCNEKGRVTHVGIIVGGAEIVHASGKVRRDRLDEKGIVNRDNNKRTHTLYSIRRFF
ncbi:MAG: NlpC/P60 family protein [Flavisolibacter sp.]